MALWPQQQTPMKDGQQSWREGKEVTQDEGEHCLKKAHFWHINSDLLDLLNHYDRIL